MNFVHGCKARFKALKSRLGYFFFKLCACSGLIFWEHYPKSCSVDCLNDPCIIIQDIWAKLHVVTGDCMIKDSTGIKGDKWPFKQGGLSAT